MSDKKEQPTPAEDFQKAFDRYLRDIKRRAADRDKKAGGGLALSKNFIDKPLSYEIPKRDPNEKVIKIIRAKFADGGNTDDDISQMRYLLSILEGSQGLTPMERKLYEDLKKDLEKIDGRQR